MINSKRYETATSGNITRMSPGGIGGSVGSGAGGGIGGNVGNGSGGIGGSTGNNNNNNSNGGNKDSCFVATAAFGTPLAYEIYVLRDYRDNRLRFLSVGRKFITFYYNFGPKVANLLYRNPLLKAPVRLLIKMLIMVLKKRNSGHL